MLLLSSGSNSASLGCIGFSSGFLSSSLLGGLLSSSFLSGLSLGGLLYGLGGSGASFLLLFSNESSKFLFDDVGSFGFNLGLGSGLGSDKLIRGRCLKK